MTTSNENSAHSSERLQSAICEKVAAMVGVAPADIDPREAFHRYGLTSVQATELVAALGQVLAMELSPTLAWEYPTVEALAHHLSGGAMPASTDERRSMPRPGQPNEPIAIVGIGCRFPGGADDPRAYWNLLRDGVDAVREVPRDRWNAEAFYDADPSRPGKTNVRRGGFIERVDGFDPLFFGISPREAETMDPQQRLALELAWEALEDAGINARLLAGSATGVFLGVTWNDYAALQQQNGVEGIVEYSATGSHHSIVANRISYSLGLQGPSVALDTACSSTLVAVHLACQSLRSGESTLALAGGVSLMLVPDGMIAMSKLRALSPDGVLRAFDADANGYVRGEGGGIIALKPLSRALADGDRVYCVLRGSATNNDGASNGLTAPNPRAQEAVLRDAYQSAGVDPAMVDYVEAHGTGTPLGDPIEVRALGSVLGRGRSEDHPLRIGSVKTNIGHLEPAAGIASLIKLALAIQHRQIPPSLHFRTPNPQIPFAALKVRVQDRLEPWPRPEEVAIAGTSSFGFGGTNCHVVVAGLSAAPARLHVLAAAGPESLQEAVLAHRDALERVPDGGADDRLVRVIGGHEPGAPWRLAVTARSSRELRERLDAFLVGATRPGLATGLAPGACPRLVFVCSGAGCDWQGMGRQLLREVPVFRATIAACDAVTRRIGGWSVLAELTDGPGPRCPSAFELQMVSIVVMEIALAAVWRAWGIQPAAVVGHSIGELAAACIAGCLTLEEAVSAICHYGRLGSQLSGKGATAVAAVSAEQAEDWIRTLNLPAVVVVAADSPFSTVVAGDPDGVRTFVAALERERIFARQVKLEVAAHSSHWGPLLPAYREALRLYRPRAGEVAFVSTVTGTFVEGERLDADYWARNMGQPVRFAAAVDQLLAAGFDAFLEIGPNPVLSHALRQCCALAGVVATVYSSLHRQADECSALLDSLGALYTRGHTIATPLVRGVHTEREAEAGELEVLPLSARSPAALVAQARRWGEYFENDGAAFGLRDIVYTAQLRRSHQAQRLALVGRSAAELVEQLRAVEEAELAPAVSRSPRVVFVFPGYGAQWLGMGRKLAATEPVFRRALVACDAALSRFVDYSVLAELDADADHTRLGETHVGQVLTFALQVALATLLQHWGLVPAAVVGHSMGEVAAAYVAGALALEDAARVIAVRNAIVREHASRRGGMLMVGADVTTANELVAGSVGRVSIAAVNAPRMLLLSGDPQPLDAIAETLKARGVFCRRVNVDYASHSPHMDPLLPLLREALAGIVPRAAAIPFCSTVSAGFEAGQLLDAGYWAHNLRSPVQFAPAIERLSASHDTFVEISTHPLLCTAIEETLRERGATGEAVSLLRRDEDESLHIRRAVARLHERGCAIDFAAMNPAGGRTVPLPTYAWQRERYWVELGDSPARPEGEGAGRWSRASDGLLGRRLQSPKIIFDTTWRSDTAPCCVGSRYPRDLESRSKRGLGGGTTAGLVDSRWRTMAAVLTTEASIEARPRSSARTREMRSK